MYLSVKTLQGGVHEEYLYNFNVVYKISTGVVKCSFILKDNIFSYESNIYFNNNGSILFVSLDNENKFSM